MGAQRTLDMRQVFDACSRAAGVSLHWVHAGCFGGLLCELHPFTRKLYPEFVTNR